MAACRILRGRANCARERVCANTIVSVLRKEVSVAIAATRNSSRRAASFCVRKKMIGNNKSAFHCVLTY